MGRHVLLQRSRVAEQGAAHWRWRSKESFCPGPCTVMQCTSQQGQGRRFPVLWWWYLRYTAVNVPVPAAANANVNVIFSFLG